MRRFIGLLIMLLALTACSPAAEKSLEPLPTLASLEQLPDLAGAERSAREFLDNWSRGNFDGMYTLTSFASQEANPLNTFTGFYQAAQEEITLKHLSYTGNTLYRERSDVAVFNYDVTFETNLVGSFTDKGRNLRLVMDTRAGDWRVAWSPGDIFADMVNGARLRLEVTIPSRANIYDRDGNILADQNGRMVAVKSVKREISDWGACIGILAPALTKSNADVQKIYDQSLPDWLVDWGTMEAASYDQNHTQLEQVCAAKFSSRPTRRYSNGTLAPHILGSVGFPDPEDLPAVEAAGFKADSVLGRSGIELYWDKTLRGQPGGRLTIVTPGGNIVREVARSSSKPPESVWLTINTDLQTYAQKVIADAYAAAKDSWGQTSKGASAVVIDVHTGEILAMVSYPSYDANAFAPLPAMGKAAAAKIVADLQTDKRRPQLNRPTQGLYPLGSVMKTVSTIAVADSGVYKLDQRYTCVGSWRRDIVRGDWLAGGHGTLTLPQALTQSCDPYFYEVGYQMDQFNPFALPGYGKRLGFGAPTGIRDVAEAAGVIPDPDWKKTNMGLTWTFSDAVNLSIGQGEMQVTPLQVARLFVGVANGGILYRPLLVKKVGILGEAPSYEATPDPESNFNVRPEVLDTTRQGLCGVTTERAGTAEYQFRHTELQTIGVCGKTGTAQDGPADAEPHAWFAAYAPRDNPEVAIVVMVENAGEGSAVAAPIVRDILLHYFFSKP